ncbi:hypothetical protein TNCV_1799861 [Trichonephila clavipes]|nr:hypothetical protein TNCV_1799861 [Trichonephila clavipes]
MIRCFQWVTDLEIIQARVTRIPCTSRKVRSRRATWGLSLCCWNIAFVRSIEDRVHEHWTQDVRNVKRCACRVPNDCRNYHNKFRTPMPILNSSRRRAISSEPPDTYAVIRTTHRIETRLKRRHWATPISSFVIWSTRVAVSLYS